MFVKFAVKQLATFNSQEDYLWVESTDIATLIRTRSLISEQVGRHKILIKIFDDDGTCYYGIDAVGRIPILAIKYSLPNGQTIIRGVTTKKEVNYNEVASCLESLKAWRLIHQRDTGDGVITNTCYFDGHSDDWKPAVLPEAIPVE